MPLESLADAQSERRGTIVLVPKALRNGGGKWEGPRWIKGVYLLNGRPVHARARTTFRDDGVHTEYKDVRPLRRDGVRRRMPCLPSRRTVRTTARPRERRARTSRTSRGDPPDEPDDEPDDGGVAPEAA